MASFNKYTVIKNAVSYELANFCYNYFLLKRDAIGFMYDNNLIAQNSFYGTWTDQQVPGCYSIYGDHVMETLLMKVLPVMKEKTGLNLVPTYSYARVYEKGSELKRHKDRPSCEISTTLCIGYDNSNVDASKYPDWDWPMFVGPKTGEIGTEGMPIHMKPGDMLIYRGDVVEHWREPLWGNNHAQVFLHYNEKEGQYDIPYDGRPLLGMPSTFRSKEALNKNEDIAVSKQDNDSESKGLFMPEYKDKVVY